MYICRVWNKDFYWRLLVAHVMRAKKNGTLQLMGRLEMFISGNKWERSSGQVLVLLP